jgi:Fic family protein
MHCISPTWFWQHDNFLETPSFPDEIFVKSSEVEALENSLFSMREVRMTEEILAEALSSEIIANWAIEGITLDTSDVRSSVIRDCGMSLPVWTSVCERGVGDERNAVSATLSLLQRQLKEMSPAILDGLHEKIAPAASQVDGRGRRLVDGGPNLWGEIRATGIQVRGRGDGKTVFVGPPPEVAKDMLWKFSDWWNRERTKLPTGIFSALAHLYFVNIHPYGDGNGRIARMLAEKGMQSERRIFRPYSLSTQILLRKSAYYDALEKARSPESARLFVVYILDRQKDAVLTSVKLIGRRAEKKRFWSKFRKETFTPTQKFMIDSMILSLSDETWDLSRLERSNIPEAPSEFRDLQARGIIENGKFNRGIVPEREFPPEPGAGAETDARWVIENGISPDKENLAREFGDEARAEEAYSMLGQVVRDAEMFGFSVEDIENWAKAAGVEARVSTDAHGNIEYVHDEF